MSRLWYARYRAITAALLAVALALSILAGNMVDIAVVALLLALSVVLLAVALHGTGRPGPKR